MMFKIIHGLVDIPAADFATPTSTRTRSHHDKKLRQFYLNGHHEVQLTAYFILQIGANCK